MQVKWLEDLIALAHTRSYVRAAESRHVTHPAFGRRIRSLELWAGTPLVEPGAAPVSLTPAGQALLQHALQAVPALQRARDELRGTPDAANECVTLATGRTLARTIAADWLVRVKPQLAGAHVRVSTGSMAETLQRFERGEADFLLTYHHPLIGVRLPSQQFLLRALAQDRLVPVTRINAQGRASHSFEGRQPASYLAYADTLALGRLVDDHLVNHAYAPRLRKVIECDSADALLEYVLKGIGIAWLPWSLAAGAVRARQLAPLGGKSMEIAFEVRMARPKRRLSALAERLWLLVDPS